MTESTLRTHLLLLVGQLPDDSLTDVVAFIEEKLSQENRKKVRQMLVERIFTEDENLLRRLAQ